MKNNLKKTKLAVAMTALLLGSYACTSEITPAEESTGNNTSSSARVADYTLRSVADFTIGVHEDSYQYENDQACQNSIIGEYDRITSQAMKMGTIQGTKGTYNYTTLDKEIKFASDNGKSVHGHTLIYWVAAPGWFKNPTSKASFEADAQAHIKNVVRHVEGKVASIDVANELFQAASADWSADSYNNVKGTWRSLYPSDDEFIKFIGRCFQWAREADNEVNGTNIKLFYLDYYHEAYPAKRDAIYAFCKKIRDFGYPIDGIGLQMHINVKTTTYAGITDAIVKAKDLTDNAGNKFLVNIAELDMRMDETKQTSSAPPAYGTADQWRQYDMVRHVVSEFRTKVPAAQKWSITLWNTSDANSWHTLYNGDYDYPTLFNDTYGRKLVYYGFLSGASSTGQYFVPERTFHLYNVNSGKYAEVTGASTANSALLQQNTYNSGNYQKFSLYYNNNGFYEVRNTNSGKSFDHYSTSPFTIQQYTYAGGNNQQYALTGLGSGQFRITSKANGNALQVVGASTAAGAKFELGAVNTASGNQKWTLVD
jgi:endo-1,4-beta-xylanase